MRTVALAVAFVGLMAVSTLGSAGPAARGVLPDVHESAVAAPPMPIRGAGPAAIPLGKLAPVDLDRSAAALPDLPFEVDGTVSDVGPLLHVTSAEGERVLQVPAEGGLSTVGVRSSSDPGKVYLLDPSAVAGTQTPADRPDHFVVRFSPQALSAVVPRPAPGSAASLQASGPSAPSGVDLLRAVHLLAEQLRASGIVESIDREYPVTLGGVAVRAPSGSLAAIEGLPYVAHAWTDGAVHATRANAVPAVGAPAVWARPAPGGGPTLGDGITIAVIDTGIDYTHPDLGGCPSVGPGCRIAGGWDFANGDGDPYDDNGHGTHVAGIAAGDGTVDGVAPHATLVAYKVLNAFGQGWTSDVLAGIEAAADPNGDGDASDHADVASLSLGAPAGEGDDPYVDAVAAGTAHGVLFAIAAGNDGPQGFTVASPGWAPEAVTVAAACLPQQAGSGYCGESAIASFSSRGPSLAFGFKPDLAAPGVLIQSTAPGGGYAIMSGTSMATPFVSGAAALVLQQHPSWTPAQVKSALVSTAQDLGAPPEAQGAGLLRVDRAVDASLWSEPAAAAFGLVPGTQATMAVGVRSFLPSASVTATITGPFNEAGETVPGASATLDVTEFHLDAEGRQDLGLTVSGLGTTPGSFHGTVVLASSGLEQRIPYTLHRFARIDVSVVDAQGDPVDAFEVSATSTDLSSHVVRLPFLGEPMSFNVGPGPTIVAAVGGLTSGAPFYALAEVVNGSLEHPTHVVLSLGDAQPVRFQARAMDGTPLALGERYLDLHMRDAASGREALIGLGTVFFGEVAWGDQTVLLDDLSSLGPDVSLVYRYVGTPAPSPSATADDAFWHAAASPSEYANGWVLSNPGPGLPAFSYGAADLARIDESFDFPGGDPNLDSDFHPSSDHYLFHIPPTSRFAFAFGMPRASPLERTLYVGGGADWGTDPFVHTSYRAGGLAAFAGSLEMTPDFGRGPWPPGAHLAGGDVRKEGYGAASYLPFAFARSGSNVSAAGPLLASQGGDSFLYREAGFGLPMPESRTFSAGAWSGWQPGTWAERAGVDQPWRAPWSATLPENGTFKAQVRLPTDFPAPSQVEATLVIPDVGVASPVIPSLTRLNAPVAFTPGQPYNGSLAAPSASFVVVQALVDGVPADVSQSTALHPGPRGHRGGAGDPDDGVTSFSVPTLPGARSLSLHLKLAGKGQSVWYNVTDAALARQPVSLSVHSPPATIVRGRDLHLEGEVRDVLGRGVSEVLVEADLLDGAGTVLASDRTTPRMSSAGSSPVWSLSLDVPAEAPREVTIRIRSPGAGIYTAAETLLQRPTLDLPSAPLALTSTAGDRGKVELTWLPPTTDGGSPVTNYAIYGGDTAETQSLLATLGNVSAYTDSGLGDNRTRSYHVAAVNAGGEGPPSEQANATTLTLAPTAPLGLTVWAGPDDGELTLNWQPPADDGGDAVTNYTVYGSLPNGTQSLVAILGNVWTFMDSGLPNDATRSYTVTASNIAGESLPSNEASATTFSAPGAPWGLQATAGVGEVGLTWQPGSNDGRLTVGYNVYRGEASGAETLYESLGVVRSYKDLHATPGTRYYYRVTSRNSAGEGALSDEVSARPSSLLTLLPAIPIPAGVPATSMSLTVCDPGSDPGCQAPGKPQMCVELRVSPSPQPAVKLACVDHDLLPPEVDAALHGLPPIQVALPGVSGASTPAIEVTYRHEATRLDPVQPLEDPACAPLHPTMDDADWFLANGDETSLTIIVQDPVPDELTIPWLGQVAAAAQATLGATPCG